MKEKTFFHDLRAYMVFVVMMILSLSGCEPCDPLIPPIKPVVVIKPADNVKLMSATMVALVIPNEDGTEVSFEYKKTVSGVWTKTFPLIYGGADSIEISSDLSGLEAGTEYSFRVKASNTAGETISDVSTFCTYAVADIDGNLYHTVQIGNQTWLKENLAVTHYKNGEPIANVTDLVAWGNLTTGAYCWYDNDPKIGEVYGALYNWYTIADPRGLAIEGWHVPTHEEWIDLLAFLSEPGDPSRGQVTAYPKLMEAGLAHWRKPLVPATNSSGFTALPNGKIGLDSELNIFMFMDLGATATFWSSSLFGPGAIIFKISIDHRFVDSGVIYELSRGLGIRLLKDAE